MRTNHPIEEIHRKATALSDEELVYAGMFCATVMTLIALAELFRLSMVMS